MRKVALDTQSLLTLCHDLRGPLGSLTTWAYVLASTPDLGPSEVRAVGAIDRAIQAEASLISQLQELAVFLEAPEPKESTADVLTAVSAVLTTRPGVNVQSHIATSDGHARASPEDLEWILRHLLNNVTPSPGDAPSLIVRAAEGVVELVLEDRLLPRPFDILLARVVAEACGATLEEVRGGGSVAFRLRFEPALP